MSSDLLGPANAPAPYDDEGPAAADEVRGLRTRVAELELALGVGQEKAWLVERQLWEDTPAIYICVAARDGTAKVNWTSRPDEALRFARREDAEAFMQTICATVRTAGVTRVVEWVWQT